MVCQWRLEGVPLLPLRPKADFLKRARDAVRRLKDV